ncbi:MAG: beta-glucosidase [Clostridia bacterium]|nr:beta-glucosidase [Clostridia bacterium]NCC44456.1 beta-glucosidase [Clostridia bacterium]
MKNRYVIDWDAYAATARRAAAEGAVLLKNENGVLPLKEGSRTAIFGRTQFDYYKSGTGSGGLVNTRYVVNIYDAMCEQKVILDHELAQTYKAWLETHPFEKGEGWGQEPWSQEEMPLDEKMIKGAAEASDTALIVIGRTAGEDKDASNTRGSYLLTEAEEDMLKKVCANFEKVVVILNVGNIIDMSWVKKYGPQAVIYTWQGGMEGGNAVADILMGNVAPCGKLTDTIAKEITDYPSTSNFGGEYGDEYQEDIYVGYRYFETFAKEKVLYPFGFGLSYTQFEVNTLKVQFEDASLYVKAEVKNTGKRAGREVVQIYVNPPQGKLSKPVRNLVGFKKTDLLQPGESCVLEITISAYTLSSYDDAGKTDHKSCYILEKGDYEVYVGSDVRSAVLADAFSLDETQLIARCQEAMGPEKPFNRMKAEWKDQKAVVAYEEAAPRRETLAQKIKRNPVSQFPYTGDRGYKLGDVYDGKVSLDDFTAQLSDKELCCMVRGEGMCSPKVTPGTAAAFGGVTEALQNYGIPCGCCSDGPSGIRMDCGTYAFSLPNGTCLACTFDEKLNRELYVFEAQEMRKNRLDMLLGPGINIHRNPLNGRNFEYFSEDPLLTGKIAAAQLRGMAEYGVTGTIKHFAANNQEYHRKVTNAIVSERALREIYLKGFEIAVKEGGAYSVMTSYGAVNGYWTASNYDLLTTILRGEWKFDGLVMTDWWADMNEESMGPSVTNLAAMLRSQNDVYMVVVNSLENSNHDNLEEALGKGTLYREQLVRSAKNILGVLLRSPVMERSLGRMSEEEKESTAQMQEEDKVDFDMEYFPVGDRLEIDVSGIDTSKGATALFGLQIETPGAYEITMQVKIDANELAQVPVTVTVGGTIMGTITMSGTNGEYVEVKQSIGEFAATFSFVKLFFAQGGMQIKKLVVTREN